MEGFNEFDLTLRSMMMFKWKKIKSTYLRRHWDYFIVQKEKVGSLLIGDLKDKI